MEFPNGSKELALPKQRRTRVRARGEEIRTFILVNVEKHTAEIAGLVASHFGITRQAANKHLHKLVEENALVPEGKTRDRRYKLAALHEWRKHYPINGESDEDRAWTLDIASELGNLPRNVLDIWHFCFTEMFNNAVDHSGGTMIYVQIGKTAANTQILLSDDGIGIFRKIQSALGLIDERHAILELAKGKLTTDPKGHTGQGIFFTSRVLDSFDILSGGVFYAHVWKGRGLDL